MKKLLLAATAALAIILGTPAIATAAPAAAVTTPVITLDANDTGLDLAPSAEDWSTRTGITVVTGTCDTTTVNCVEFSKDQCTSMTAGGCSWVADGICQVSISSLAYDRDYWFTVYVTSHEVGHCVQWYGGAGMYHLDSDRAVMGDGNPIKFFNEKGARLTNEDRQMAQAIYG